MRAQQQKPSRAEAISIGIVIFFDGGGPGRLVRCLGCGLARTAGSTDPVYTVAITGAAGLEGLDLGRPTLSPVFNLTVRIDNTGNKLVGACVGSLSTAAVSYGDALHARGSVPPFSAGEEQESERAATAWGLDVVVPRFLRERLAGELRRGEGEVDVQVTTPAGSSHYDTVLVCKVKIGGGQSPPCRRDYVYLRPAPASGSTALAA
ncbi:hypothetical protein PVAP13_7KG244800 [Panicum virgatum]|uniref:Late embryogenesis abundant protein LEA-2 subgroup domain-containing protein n=1 Tax=Panicum virgatum TaxID=38727 RepID=A0A8T0QKK6_PANVG|nr:hypothetical protein PVAP13_7KG244800 [Panicum virgatum]